MDGFCKKTTQLLKASGSVQLIREIPEDLKEIYKTAWEISQRVVIDQAAARGPYVCQSQSMNLFVNDPSRAKLSSIHFHSWSKGLKTGSYYIRTKEKVSAIQFTIDDLESKKTVSVEEEKDCLTCSA